MKQDYSENQICFYRNDFPGLGRLLVVNSTTLIL